MSTRFRSLRHRAAAMAAQRETRHLIFYRCRVVWCPPTRVRLKQRVNGPVEELVVPRGRRPYEVARDAARDDTGLPRIKWARGKGENTRAIERGEIPWDYVSIGSVTYGWVDRA